MGDPEINIQVFTNWQVNSPIRITGNHHGKFENKGVVLEYEPERKLSYTHLSSVSSLEDVLGNYSFFEFILTPLANERATQLTITVKNFPTDVIRKHLELYWKTTILVIKDIVEKSSQNNN
jgi:hypothetical protein